jgi:hypothetical protein
MAVRPKAQESKRDSIHHPAGANAVLDLEPLHRRSRQRAEEAIHGARAVPDVVQQPLNLDHAR